MGERARPVSWSSHRVRRTVSLLAALAFHLPATLDAADSPDKKTESDRLFYEGNELMKQGRVAEACTKFEHSVELLRRGGALLNLALCRESAGALTAALPLFEEALAFAVQDGKTDRQDIAKQHIEALRAKLTWLTITLSPGADLPGLSISCDGAALPREKWGSPVAMNPGAHVVVATAPGRDPFQTQLPVTSAGETRTVQIPILPELPSVAPVIRPGAPQSVEPASPRSTVPESPREVPLGHGFQVGAIARVDVDPIHPGARAVAGATFGLTDHLEIGASALIGPEMGVEPQLTFFVLGKTPYKPLVNVGVPIFFVDGTQVGVRGAVGLQWDVGRHFGVFAQVGGAYFGSAAPGYARGVFLPSAGVQGRL